jgi:hypothetical protein
VPLGIENVLQVYVTAKAGGVERRRIPMNIADFMGSTLAKLAHADKGVLWAARILKHSSERRLAIQVFPGDRGSTRVPLRVSAVSGTLRRKEFRGGRIAERRSVFDTAS